MAIQADVVVVGAGASGLGAASAARRKGASVVLVERGRLGGECTWTGCVPSKALLERAREVRGGRRQGLTGEVDVARIFDEVRAASVAIGEDESAEALATQGIRVLTGEATFTGPRRLTVDGTAVEAARAIIIATGSVPLVPPVEGLAAAQPLTNETVFDLRSLPSRLAVLGGGPIGCELAQAFARLDSTVTVIEAEKLLAKEEPEAAQVLTGVLADEGVDVRTGVRVTRVTRPDPSRPVTLTTSDGDTVEADAVLVAAGRRARTDGLALERAGVRVDERGWIMVDDKLRTSAEGVLAIGDVVGGLQFTHAGYEMGALAVANALGRRSRTYDTAALPWVTFTDPEIGRVGMTEAQAAAAHSDAARVAYLPMADTDRGRATGRTEGFVKLIAGPRGALRGLGGGVLLGATVVCPSGGDVVHEAALLMRSGAFVGRLAQTVHAYPAWSLAVRECAAQFFLTQRGRSARPARADGGT